MNHKDKYATFAELIESECETRDFGRIITTQNSAITIIAPHGGGIEPGTSEIAKAIADSDFSMYCFEGLRVRGNYEALHITGTHFDDPECLQLTDKSKIVLAVHGCDGEEKIVYVGGLNEDLKAKIIAALKEVGFQAEKDVSSHSGRDPHNICNRGIQTGGVQLEISEGLRREMFRGLKRRERQFTEPSFDIFVDAIRTALLELDVVGETGQRAIEDGGRV
ncbi:MAG TPA: poly-gamma-glutamate hydrolase family protein [Pyrinomonadaceae bacterium]|nr:poly-gamma-glutamate hydrolase family protein [Pyrinomonadaceae bacterium]